MSNALKRLKKKIRGGELTLGSWLTIGNPTVLEVMIDAGFEWIVIDLEHSMISLPELSAMLAVGRALDFPLLVRLTSNDAAQAKRVLDAGASGVLVPMIKNRGEVAAAVNAVKYPPLGTRSVGLFRAQGYGTTFDTYAKNFNTESLVIPQIEHAVAIENLEEIISHPQVDATIIGPYDLSGSVGKPGSFKDRGVVRLLGRYEEVSKRLKKPMGFHVVPPDPKEVLTRVERGYRFIAVSVDFLLLRSRSVDTLGSIRKALR